MKKSTSPFYLSNWMGELKYHMKLKNLILPGANASNSKALYKPKWALPFARCQTISVCDQLNLGVRYLDVKFGVRKDKIYEMLNITKYFVLFS